MTDEADWDVERRSPGHPVIAVLAGAAVLVFLAVSSPQWLGHQPLTMLLAGGAAIALLLWLVAFAVSVRRAWLKWKIGSLAILLAVGAGAGFGADLLRARLARSDLTSLAEVEVAPDGGPVFPRDAMARGPISRMFVVDKQATATDDRDYAMALGKLGLAPLNSPYLLSQSPEVLGRCSDVAKFKPVLAQKNARRQERLDRTLAAIDHADASDELRRGARMMVVPGGSREGLDAMLAQDVELLDVEQALCVLLAKRSWSNAGGYFGFSSGADRAAFDALERRRREAVRRGAELQRADKDRLTAGREIIRNILGD